MKIHDVKQGTEAWLAARAGIFTVSEIDNLITPEWKPRTGQMPQTYIYRKVAERIMGIPLVQGGSWAMDQGTLLESEAIPFVQFTYGVKVERVGFITNDEGTVGASPDGLVGNRAAGLEIKCPQPDTHVRYLVGGRLPKEYAAQVHGSMYVTGLKEWHFLSYSRQFPPLFLTVKRDEAIMGLIDEALRPALALFTETVARVRAIKDEYESPKRAEYERKIKEWETTGVVP